MDSNMAKRLSPQFPGGCSKDKFGNTQSHWARSLNFASITRGL